MNVLEAQFLQPILCTDACKRKPIVHGTKQMNSDMLFTQSCCLDRVQVTRIKSLKKGDIIITILILTPLTSPKPNLLKAKDKYFTTHIQDPDLVIIKAYPFQFLFIVAFIHSFIYGTLLGFNFINVPKPSKSHL